MLMRYYEGMIINFNGVRGSIPFGRSPNDMKELLNSDRSFDLNNQEDFIKYCGLGFHSTNIMIENDKKDSCLLIDGGSGIMSAANKIFRDYAREPEINILQTHFHWDHLMGYNFFPQVYMGKVINIYSPLDNLEENFAQLFTKPFFPIEYSFLKSNSEFNFFKVDPYKQYNISSFDVTFYKLDHPDPCWGPRVSIDGKTYSHAIDTEAERLDMDSLGKDSGLYENCDLLHFDAPYLEEEVIGPKKGWGHGSTLRAFKLAELFNIKEISFGHYTPDVNYQKYQKILSATSSYFDKLAPNLKNKLKYNFTYDGQIINI